MEVVLDRDAFLKGLQMVQNIVEPRQTLPILANVLLETEGERSRFRAAGGMRAGPGSAGSLIPPHEYHTIHNGSDDAIAVSVHIYEGRMDQCCRFEPEDGEWYRRVPATLTIDRAA